MTLRTLEQSVFDHLLKYEGEVAGKHGNHIGPNIEYATGRDRQFDEEFDALLQKLEDRGLIRRHAECHYRITEKGKEYSKRV